MQALVADSEFHINVGGSSVGHTMDVMVSRFAIAKALFEDNANDVTCTPACPIQLQIKKIKVRRGEERSKGCS